jgi:alkyl hydroperoxide reductase subunit F
MATFITLETKNHLRQTFAQLRAPVRLVYFTSAHACGACADQRALLEEVAALSEKITLEVRELTADAPEAARLGIDKVPATIVLGERDYGIRFFGLTGGYEFGSLIEAIVMVSTGRSGLDPAIEAMARAIRASTHLEVMVTLTCPYCPAMVRLAHQLAFVNAQIRADMIDLAEFPALVARYDVHGVPRMVINGRPAFEGALPPEAAVLEILKEVEPEEYERIDAALRAARGERKAIEATPDRTYDIVVVGAGPAGLSAALYGVRKGRQVALIGKKAGGQVNDTATIENYLGMTHVGGRELAEQFRNHVEAYPVAERCHTAAKEIRRAGDLFEVVTEDGRTYRGRTVIYAAGKQYRTLGVPGEERFIGRGIAFCATCDAPLYRDRRVAVIGGGNSALTAVRDLRSFAREIHVVQNLPHLTADPVLIDEVKGMKNVALHLGMQVREFLGGDRLTGVRISSADGRTRYDLAVDGAFLEIGLVPNADPVRALLALNGAGEVPIRRDQSTAVPGLFAAGDVTDEPEKQIIIAAGDGARAALAADRYLASVERGALRQGAASAQTT